MKLLKVRSGPARAAITVVLSAMMIILFTCCTGYLVAAQSSSTPLPQTSGQSSEDLSLLLPLAAIPLILAVVFVLFKSRERAARQAHSAIQVASACTAGTVTHKSDFEVFISYSSKDKLIADAVCDSLEAAGIRCWIAPRDVVMGDPFEESIINAINVARVTVFVLTGNSNASVHVENELKAAWRRGIPIIPYRAEDVLYGKTLEYYLGSTHWIDASKPPVETHLRALTETVHEKLGQGGNGS